MGSRSRRSPWLILDIEEVTGSSPVWPMTQPLEFQGVVFLYDFENLT